MIFFPSSVFLLYDDLELFSDVRRVILQLVDTPVDITLFANSSSVMIPP